MSVSYLNKVSFLSKVTLPVTIDIYCAVFLRNFKQAGQKRFIFEGREINLVWSCGIFITMNPGYAGRTELPDNLKSMFRPISMVVPDTGLIAEIMLTGEGFDNARGLAKKVDVLYSLAIKQLSKQVSGFQNVTKCSYYGPHSLISFVKK